MDFIISLIIVFLFGGVVGLIFWYYNLTFNGKETLFGVLGSIGVGILGATVGFFYLGSIVNWLVINPLNVNFVAALFGSIILLWIGLKINPYNQ